MGCCHIVTLQKSASLPENTVFMLYTMYLRSLRLLGKACCKACPSRVAASGVGLSGGCWPDSPSRSDTVLLLCVAVRPRRGSRVGSNLGRQAQISAIRASFVGSSSSAAMHNRDSCARWQAPPRANLRHSIGLHRENRAVRRLNSTTMQEGDRASTTGAETV